MNDHIQGWILLVLATILFVVAIFLPLGLTLKDWPLGILFGSGILIHSLISALIKARKDAK